MLAGRHPRAGRRFHHGDGSQGAVSSGRMSEEELKELEDVACPGCGSCAGLFTANSMNCLTEAVGMGLPGNGTIPAVYSARLRLAKQAGMRALHLIESGLRPAGTSSPKRPCATPLAVDMAIGGILQHRPTLLAIAYEAGVELSLEEIQEVCDGTPNLVRIEPGRRKHPSHAGPARSRGIPAVMGELANRGLIDLAAPCVGASSMGEIIKDRKSLDPSVIRPVDDPYMATGGLAILTGNLAPRGHRQAVGRSRRPAASGDESSRLRGRRGSCSGHASGKHQGRRRGRLYVMKDLGGGRACARCSIQQPPWAGMGLSEDVVLVTDGRFSGGTRGRHHRSRLPRGGAGWPHSPGAGRRRDRNRHTRAPHRAQGGRSRTCSQKVRLGSRRRRV